MIDKAVCLEEALEGVGDGATVMVGGFGAPGTPFALLDRLLTRGISDLVLVKNDANEPGMGISRLLEAGRVRTLISSHIGLNPEAVAMMNRREIEVELYPQGILAEKIRAGGAGLLGFLTDIGVDTVLRESRQIVTVEGREAILELPLRADVALVHAATADRAGNVLFAATARNFSPLMAMGAGLTIVEAEEIVEPGEIDPDAVHLPGAFVDRIVPLGELTSDYGVLPNHVL